MLEQQKNNMNKILLHACCAVCAGYPINLLMEQGFEPIVYFFNPNIYPEDEHNRRLQELIRYCEKKSIKLIIEKNAVDSWYKHVQGLENEKEKGLRCHKCFEFRLNKTAEKAKELNIKKFTTTLFISPHKIREDIIREGNKAAQKFDRIFVDTDFRKQNGFLKTMQIAKEEKFYRQTYCGCEFAMKKQQAIQI